MFPRNTLIAAAIGSFLCAPAFAQQDAALELDIPAGKVGTVINAIGARFGGQVRIAAAPDHDVVVPGLKGRYTLVSALTEAVKGTRYRVAAAGHGEVRISLDSGNLSEVIVTARRDTTKKSDSQLLTRTDTSLQYTPVTIDSVTEEMLRSRNSTSLEDALRNIPGVVFQQNGASSGAYIRGETTQGVTFTNGLRNSAIGGLETTIDVEAVEVLKGPASILTGVDVPGGLINYVPKRALGNSPTTLDVGIGSGGEMRASVDTGGTLSRSDRLYWRFVGLAQHADHELNGSGDPHAYVASAILGYRDHGWKVDATLKYSDVRIAPKDFYYYSPAAGSYTKGEILSDGRNGTTKSATGTYSLEKDLVSTPGLTLRFRNRGLFQDADLSYQTQGPAYPGPAANYRVLPQSGIRNARQFSNFADLYAKFSTGPLQHQAIVAIDYAHATGRTATGFGSAYKLPTSSVIPDLPAPSFDDPAVGSSHTESTQWGGVLQDQVAWGRFHVLAAMRQSWYRENDYSLRSVNSGGTRSDQPETRARRFLPNAGLVYDVTDDVSAYASYQRSFTPGSPYVTSSAGSVLPPILRTQYEAGVKTAFLNDKASLNVAVFEYRTSNTAKSDPSNDNFYVTGPGAKAHGMEVSLQGQLADTVRMTSGVTWEHARDADGNLNTGTSEWVANLWALKQFRLGDKRSAEVGLGGEYRSRPAMNTVDFSTYGYLPRDYRALDASLGYAWGDMRLNLTVDNLTNRRNFVAPVIAYWLPLATSRRMRLVLSTQF